MNICFSTYLVCPQRATLANGSKASYIFCREMHTCRLAHSPNRSCLSRWGCGKPEHEFITVCFSYIQKPGHTMIEPGISMHAGNNNLPCFLVPSTNNKGPRAGPHRNDSSIQQATFARGNKGRTPRQASRSYRSSHHRPTERAPQQVHFPPFSLLTISRPTQLHTHRPRAQTWWMEIYHC